MTRLNRYNENVVVLRDEDLGCIPWAIEWMIRYKFQRTGRWEIPEAHLATFQDIYNLESNTDGATKNNFTNILREIRRNHSTISLKHKYNFQNGTDKFQQIENLIGEEISIIMPIKPTPQSNAHIMPVYEVTPDIVRGINRITNQGNIETIPFRKNALIRMHDSGQSGKAIVYLP